MNNSGCRRVLIVIDIFDYFFQKDGIKSSRIVNISRRPINIIKDNIHFETSGIIAKLVVTPTKSVFKPEFEIAEREIKRELESGIPDRDSITPPATIMNPYMNKNARVLFTMAGVVPFSLIVTVVTADGCIIL